MRDQERDEAFVFRAYQEAVDRLAEGQEASMLALRTDPLLARIQFTPIKLGLELSLVEFYEHVREDALKAIRHLYQACRIKKNPHLWARLYRLCRARGLLEQAEFAVRQALRISLCPYFDVECSCMLAELLFLRGQPDKAKAIALEHPEQCRSVVRALAGGSDLAAERERLGRQPHQPRSWSQPRPREQVFTVQILLEKLTWQHLVQSLYLVYRVLSLEQHKKKYSKLQEACKGHFLHNTLISFRPGKNGDPQSISFLLNDLRTRLFVRRRKYRDDLRRTLRLSATHDRQPVTLHTLRDCKHSQQQEKTMLSIQYLYQELDPRCAESPLQDLLENRTPEKEDRAQYHPEAATTNSLEAQHNARLEEWLKDRHHARLPLQWAEDVLELFLANSRQGEEVVPHEMLQDFEWCCFRMLVVKLYKRVQVSYPGVVEGRAQKLTLLELMWDLTPELRSKWAKSKSQDKLQRHGRMVQGLLSDVQAGFSGSELARHPFMRLRMLITGLILQPQELQEQSLSALKKEMGLSGNLSFFWLKTVIRENFQETLAERTEGNEVRRMIEQHRGTLQELSYQLLAEFSEKVTKGLNWDQYINELIDLFRKTPAEQLVGPAKRYLQTFLEVLNQKPEKEDSSRFVLKTAQVFKLPVLLTLGLGGSREPQLAHAWLKINLLRFYAEQHQSHQSAILTEMVGSLSLLHKPASLIFLHQLSHRSPGLYKHSHRAGLFELPAVRAGLPDVLEEARSGSDYAAEASGLLECMFRLKAKKVEAWEEFVFKGWDEVRAWIGHVSMTTSWLQHDQDSLPPRAIAQLESAIQVARSSSQFTFCSQFPGMLSQLQRFLAGDEHSQFFHYTHARLENMTVCPCLSPQCYKLVPSDKTEFLTLVVSARNDLQPMGEDADRNNEVFRQLIKELLVIDPCRRRSWQLVYEDIFVAIQKEFEDRLLVEHEFPGAYQSLVTVGQAIMRLFGGLPQELSRTTTQAAILHASEVYLKYLSSLDFIQGQKAVTNIRSFQQVVGEFRLLKLAMERLDREQMWLASKFLFWNYFDMIIVLDTARQMAPVKRKELEMVVLLFKTAQHLRKSCASLQCDCLSIFLKELATIIPEYTQAEPVARLSMLAVSPARRDRLRCLRSFHQIDLEKQEFRGQMLDRLYSWLLARLRGIQLNKHIRKNKGKLMRVLYYMAKASLAMGVEVDKDSVNQLSKEVKAMSAFARRKQFSEIWDYLAMVDLFKYSALIVRISAQEKVKLMLKRIAKKNVPPAHFIRTALCRMCIDRSLQLLPSQPTKVQQLATLFDKVFRNKARAEEIAPQQLKRAILMAQQFLPATRTAKFAEIKKMLLEACRKDTVEKNQPILVEISEQ